MDINAKFSADFTEFNTGVTVAEDKLKSIAGEADKTAAALTTIEPPLTSLTSSAQQGATATNTLGQALGQVDKTLGLAGINIGKGVGALKELGAVAGSTATQIGLIGTAGAVVGAGLIGWNIGRAVAGFFDLDRVIADTTSALLGFGNVAEQVALAQVDELTRATNRVNREITDLAEARRINAGAAQAEAAAAQKVAAADDAARAAISELNKYLIDSDAAVKTLEPDVRDFARELLTAGASAHNVAVGLGQNELAIIGLKNAIDAEKKAADAYAETVKKVQAVETSQLTGRITGLNELGRVEEVQSNARIQRAIKEVAAFEEAMTREAAAAKAFNAARAGAGAIEDPILKAAMEQETAIGRANQRWPQGGEEASAIIAAAATKFQDAVNQVTAGNKPGGFMTGQVPFSQLAPVTINVSGWDQNSVRTLAAEVGDVLMRNSSRQYPGR
jgi:hypothetical protein